MSTYPTLRTGAVAQYPLAGGIRHRTALLTFMDGREQRYALQRRNLRRWVLTYSQLDEGEMQLLRTFVESQAQFNTPFSFTDPDTHLVFPRCRMLQAELDEQWQGLEAGSARVEIVEVMD